MFKRVGKEIRIWAKVLVILQLIPAVILCIGGAFLLIEEADFPPVLAILAALVVLVLWYFLVRLSMIMLYSWGELVERVVCIDEKLEKMSCAAPIAPAAPAVHPAPPAPTPVPSYGYTPPTPMNPPAAKTAPVVSQSVKSAPAASGPARSPIPASQQVKNVPVLDDSEYTVAAGHYNPPKKQEESTSPIYSRPVAREWTCTACGQKNGADGSWCRNCGAKKSV